MDYHDLLAKILVALVPTVMSIITWAVTRTNIAIRKREMSDRKKAVLETAANLIATGVADAYQTVVSTLKDPHKPGTWTEAAGQAVKRTVIADAKEGAPALMRDLEETGFVDIDALLSRLVEQSVVALKAKTPLTYQDTIKTPVNGVTNGKA